MTARGSGLAGSLALTGLLERDEELDALRIVIGEAAAGRSRVVVVEGAAGIGKTRLLAAARTLAAEAHLRVLGARGGELEREFAFGIVRQLFESQAAQAKGAFDGAAAAAHDALGLPDPSTEPDANPSFASLHGLYWLTVNLSAGAPLVIAIDDLQWCDSPSLRFLAYLVHRLEGLSVLVLATLRSSARADSMLIGEIVGDPVTVSIKPKPLSTRAVGRLVRERLGEQADEVFRTACHAATGGNPLLVHELLKTLQIEGVAPDAAHLAAVEHLGPRAVSRAVLMRLARLPDAAVGIARAVAVLGDQAAISHVAALAGTDLEQMNGAVLALVDAEILRPGPSLGFVHPLVEAAVRNDIPDVERALAHERSATLLAEGGADAERVAAHLLASPTRGEPKSVETLVSAARSSLRRGGVESAVAYLARALREPPAPARRAELLLELGRAEALTNGPAALEHLGDAYELLDEPRSRVSAALLLGRCLLLTGRAAEGAAVARQTAAELGPEFDDERLALEALELMAIFMAGGDDRALGPRDRRRRDPVGAGIGAKMLAAVTVQEWAVSGGACAACADLALEALAGGELIGADNGLLSVAPIVVLALADREEALAAWEHSLAEAHRRGSLFARKSVTLWHGFTMYWRGDLVEAQASLKSSDEGLWGMGQTGRRYFDAILSAVLRERGDLVAARHALEKSASDSGADDATRYWLHSQLELLVAEGRFEDALAVAEDFESRFAQLVNPVDTPWRSPTVVALSRVGREREARSLAATELEQARRWGAPGTVARALRVAATVTGEQELDMLRQATELAAASPARLEHAKALAATGGALRRVRRPADAREPLRRALELADTLGARGLAEHARAELYAAGGRPRTKALSGVEALTPSERRVVELAAGGRTNREIAQGLFVTPKTVELHLSNAYRKLGIRSRRELPSQLGDGPSVGA